MDRLRRVDAAVSGDAGAFSTALRASADHITPNVRVSDSTSQENGLRSPSHKANGAHNDLWDGDERPPCGTIERDTGVALLGAAGFGPSEDRARRAEKLERVRHA